MTPKGFKKIVLPNGLRLLLAPQPESLAATILILVEAGSEYETKSINGLSHFLEHLTFKGTKKRPKPGMISGELDSLGAKYNAFTSWEYTGYWAKAECHKLSNILEIISDLYLNPIFNPEEIEKERGVVIEEINMYEDTPMQRVQEVFTLLLYGDQPAGWEIVGKKEIIRRLKAPDFVRYREKHYVARGTVVAVAGNFEEKKVVAQVKSFFGHLGKRSKPHKAITRETQRKPRTRIKFKTSDQSHLVLGVRAFDIFDARRFVLQVLADILGGGMSSRLWWRIREELGAAYYIHADPEFFLDHGYLEVSAGVDHQKIETVIKTIIEELRRLRDEKVGTKELRKSKDHLIGGIVLGLETSDELAGFYGSQEVLTRSILHPQQLVDKIQRVDAGEIQRVAKEIFRNEKLNLAVIGPYKNVTLFEKILKL